MSLTQRHVQSILRVVGGVFCERVTLQRQRAGRAREPQLSAVSDIRSHAEFSAQALPQGAQSGAVS